MGLKHLKLPTETVETPGGDFAVRGISFSDVSALIQSDGPELSALFDHYSGSLNGDDLSTTEVMALSGSLNEIAPDIAAKIIVTAADGDEDDLATIRKLPFPVQVDALEKIVKLTFDSTGGPKKLVETAIRVFRGTTSLMGELQASKSGLSVSGGR